MSRSASSDLPKSGVILCNPEACHGCGICELVCSLSHDGVCGPSVSRITLIREPLAGEFHQATCKQCHHPECYYNCPVEAVQIEPKTGARIIDAELCTGCGTCAKACPFNEQGSIVKQNPDTGKWLKCDLCVIQNGPQCVSACPWGALRYVSQEERGL